MNLIEDNGLKKREDYIFDNVIVDGVLARTVLLPKGDVVVGEKHKSATINILVRGEVKVWIDGKIKHLKAPKMVTSKANTRKVVYVLEEAVWTSIHRVNSTDLKEIEKEVIVETTEKELLEELKQINMKELQWLG